MAERIDMSLDDIIKRDRIRSSAPRRGGIANKLGNRRGAAGGRATRGMPVRKIGAVSRQMKTGARRPGNNVGTKVGRKFVSFLCFRITNLFCIIARSQLGRQMDS